MRMAKRRIARRVRFEKCPIPWKELSTGIIKHCAKDKRKFDFKSNECKSGVLHQRRLLDFRLQELFPFQDS